MGKSLSITGHRATSLEELCALAKAYFHEVLQEVRIDNEEDCAVVLFRGPASGLWRHAFAGNIPFERDERGFSIEMTNERISLRRPAWLACDEFLDVSMTGFWKALGRYLRGTLVDDV